MIFNQNISSEKSMAQFGKRLSNLLLPPLYIALEGTLGAGKTTLVRAVLSGLGYQGIVRSPTYTLVEIYELPSITVFHLDLYRLDTPQSLEFLGIEEIFQANALWLIEWPSKGSGFLPTPDLICEIALEQGTERTLKWKGLSQKGKQVLQLLAACY